MEEFWEKWLEADELDRLKLVEALPIYRKMTKDCLALLVNSYFSDLAGIVERKTEERFEQFESDARKW